MAILLAGIEPAVQVQKTGKVKPEHRTWDAVKRALLSNIQGFVDLLRDFKALVDDFKCEHWIMLGGCWGGGLWGPWCVGVSVEEAGCGLGAMASHLLCTTERPMCRLALKPPPHVFPPPVVWVRL